MMAVVLVDPRSVLLVEVLLMMLERGMNHVHLSY